MLAGAFYMRAVAATLFLLAGGGHATAEPGKALRTTAEATGYDTTGRYAEAVAMLRADPALRKEFEQALSSDAEFAKDTRRRLDFFYRRHPAWDGRKDEYPVVRVDSIPR